MLTDEKWNRLRGILPGFFLVFRTQGKSHLHLTSHLIDRAISSAAERSATLTTLYTMQKSWDTATNDPSSFC
jgi:hypothetical protein